jgi:hypothetical protein
MPRRLSNAFSRLEDALEAASSLQRSAAGRLGGICAEDQPHRSEHARGCAAARLTFWEIKRSTKGDQRVA